MPKPPIEGKVLRHLSATRIELKFSHALTLQLNVERANDYPIGSTIKL